MKPHNCCVGRVSTRGHHTWNCRTTHTLPTVSRVKHKDLSYRQYSWKSLYNYLFIAYSNSPRETHFQKLTFLLSHLESSITIIVSSFYSILEKVGAKIKKGWKEGAWAPFATRISSTGEGGEVGKLLPHKQSSPPPLPPPSSPPLPPPSSPSFSPATEIYACCRKVKGNKIAQRYAPESN